MKTQLFNTGKSRALSLCLSVRLSVNLSDCLTVCLSVCVSHCLSVCLSVTPAVSGVHGADKQQKNNFGLTYLVRPQLFQP